MADIEKVKRNISKMIEMNAPEADIDRYVASEGVSLDQLRQPSQKSNNVEESALNRLKAGITGAAQGLTFGYADELKSAVTGRPVEEIRAEDKALSNVYPVTSTVSEIGGAVLSPVSKIGGIAKGANLAARVGRGALVGAGQGAVYGFGKGEGNLEDRTEGATKGAIIGGVLGGAMPAVVSAGKEAIKPFSSSLRLSGKKTGIENVVEDRSSLGQIKTGVRSSDEIASQMDDIAPKMRETIYKKTAQSVDDAFGRQRIDINKSIANKEDMIKRFYAQKGDTPIELPRTFAEGMNPEQIGFLEKAIKTGSARTTSEPNSLNALAEAKRELQSQISRSMIPDPKNPMKMVSTPETAQLQGVVSKLDKTLKSSVPEYGKINDSFSKTMRTKSAYEMGLRGSEDGLKTLSTNVEKQAFRQGLKEKLIGQVESAGYNTGEDVSKKILGDEGLYRSVIGSQGASKLARRLSQMSNATKDVNSIQKTAYDKLGRDVSELPFMREVGETTGSMRGALADKIMGIGQGKARESAARKLLTEGLQFPEQKVRTGQTMSQALMPLMIRE